jgi:hypothetical protein
MNAHEANHVVALKLIADPVYDVMEFIIELHELIGIVIDIEFLKL